jgi:hypothetical protein
MLTSTQNSFYLYNNAALSSISVPLLASVNEQINIQLNPLLPSLSFPALGYENGGFIASQNVALETISLGGAVLDFFNVIFTGNALTQAGVDDILIQIDTKAVMNNVVDYTPTLGTFQVGEVVTGGTSLATGTITWDDSGVKMRIKVTSGTFQVGEVITGATSLATGNTTTVTLPNLDMTGGTNSGLLALSPAGLAAYNSLIAKGWTVLLNA